MSAPFEITQLTRYNRPSPDDQHVADANDAGLRRAFRLNDVEGTVRQPGDQHVHRRGAGRLKHIHGEPCTPISATLEARPCPCWNTPTLSCLPPMIPTLELLPPPACA